MIFADPSSGFSLEFAGLVLGFNLKVGQLCLNRPSFVFRALQHESEGLLFELEMCDPSSCLSLGIDE